MSILAVPVYFCPNMAVVDLKEGEALELTKMYGLMQRCSTSLALIESCWCDSIEQETFYEGLIIYGRKVDTI
jgi:hypothetical protein